MNTICEHHPIIIIGTGFGGLAMGHELKQKGVEDFIILERAKTAGGTWRDNHYPGAACDVPARLYSLSFAQKSDWSRRYPTQPELKQYQEDVAEQTGLLPHIRFNHAVISMRWQERQGLWLIETSQGRYSANYLVTANGGLAEPKNPDIPGVECFQGRTFHSATWDHDYDLQGKRVAVIGTGASAIQFVPEVAKQAGQLDVYQRSPNWVIPRPDRKITVVEKFLLEHLPGYRSLMRGLEYLAHELRVLGIVVNPSIMKLFQRVAEKHIARQVHDPKLRAQVTPDYLIGCRRILISDAWYPALGRDNVELVTDGIREIRANSIVDAQGVERDVDVIIFGTGFYATENPIAQHVYGRKGQKLADAWADGEHAYLGMTVHGFPNLFLMAGPNTGIGHTSMIYMLECMAGYIGQALAPRVHSGEVLEVRKAVEDAFNVRLQDTLANSVWSTGCRSWYQHKSGQITTLWPGFTFNYALQTRAFRASDYQFLAATDTQPASPESRALAA